MKRGRDLAGPRGLLQTHDVREQDLFFLHHVGQQFIPQLRKSSVQLAQLSVTVPVPRDHLVQQLAQPGQL